MTVRPQVQWLALLVACIALGCGSHDRGAPPEAVVSAASTTAPLSPAFVVKYGRSAFHRRDAAWLGGGHGYRVRAELAKVTVQVPGAASIALGPPSIERDGVDLAVATQAIEPQPSGAISVDRRVARETLENRDDGLEQSWAFNVAPPGRGGLVVRVPVLDGGTGARVDRGLRFADPAGGKAILFSDATWVDAAGRRTAIPAVWSRGAIELDVPATVVMSSAYPAMLDPTIGPEFPLPGGPAVAYTNGVYLVAWAGSPGIFGARVRSSDGVVLDPAGFEIEASANADLAPVVAGEGGQFLVAWGEASGSSASTVLKGARVRALDAAVLDSPGVTLSNPIAGTLQLAVAASGTAYLLGWVESGSLGAYVERVAVTDLTVLDSSPIVLPMGGLNHISLASDGTDFCAAYNYCDSCTPPLSPTPITGVIQTRIRSSDGSLLDPSGVILGAAGGYEFSAPSVTYGPTDYAVSYIVYLALARTVIPGCTPSTDKGYSSSTLSFDGIDTFVAFTAGSGTAGYFESAGCAAAQALPGGLPMLASNGAGQTLLVVDDGNAFQGIFVGSCDAGLCGTSISDDGGAMGSSGSEAGAADAASGLADAGTSGGALPDAASSQADSGASTGGLLDAASSQADAGAGAGALPDAQAASDAGASASPDAEDLLDATEDAFATGPVDAGSGVVDAASPQDGQARPSENDGDLATDSGGSGTAGGGQGGGGGCQLSWGGGTVPTWSLEWFAPLLALGGWRRRRRRRPEGLHGAITTGFEVKLEHGQRPTTSRIFGSLSACTCTGSASRRPPRR